MGNRQNCAKFQENVFRSNKIISFFCPPLFRKRPIPIQYVLKSVFLFIIKFQEGVFLTEDRREVIFVRFTSAFFLTIYVWKREFC